MANLKRDYIVSFRDKYKNVLEQVVVKDSFWYQVQNKAEELVSEKVKNSYDNIATLPIN